MFLPSCQVRRKLPHLPTGTIRATIATVHSDIPMRASVFPPGQPTVDRAGPLLPALETKTTLCFLTKDVICSRTALEREGERRREKEREGEREKEREHIEAQ